MTVVLGISAFYHDSAAAIVRDGEIVAAAQEERFTRKKHDASFRRNALRYCVRKPGVSLADIDFVAFYEKPFLKFERLLETYLAFAPRGFGSFRMAMPLWLKRSCFRSRCWSISCAPKRPTSIGKQAALYRASRKPRSERILSVAVQRGGDPDDGRRRRMGDDQHGRSGAATALALNEEIHFPHSLGLLYSAFTYYTGFKVNSGEYKVMGLAPYGEPKYAQTIMDNLIDIQATARFA